MSTTNNLLPKSIKEANFREWLFAVETNICNTSTQHPTAMAGAVLGDEHLARIYQGGPIPSTTTYPLNPGNPPVKPVQLNTTDEAFLKEMKAYRLLLGDYTTESKAYTEHLATIASIKDDIVNTLHDTDRTELSHPHSGMRLVTIRQIMDHMWGKYGRLTATDMAKLREDTKTIYTPGTDMSDFIANLNRKYTELAMNSEPINEPTKANHLLLSVSACSIFAEVTTQYERMYSAAGSQLYSGPTGLAKILTDEEKRLRSKMVGNTGFGNTGFGNAAIGITSTHAEHIKTIAALTAEIAALQASATHTRSASLITKTCAACNTKFDTLYHANVECKKCYELKKTKAAADAKKGTGGGRGGRGEGKTK